MPAVVGNINERQVDLRTGNARYFNLKEYLDGREVILGPVVKLATVSSGGAVVQLNTTHLGSGSIIAIGASTQQTSTSTIKAYVAASTTVLGTGQVNWPTLCTYNFSDEIGNILNRVDIRYSDTNDQVTVRSGTDIGRSVFGIITSTATDGDAVGASGSENIQIAFVYYDASDVIKPYIFPDNQNIEFNMPVVYRRRDLPVIVKAGGSATAGGGGSAEAPAIPEIVEASYLITTSAGTGETLTLSTGAFDGTGVSTKSGDTITLPATSVLTYADKAFDVELNGISLVEGAGKQVEWASATTLKFNIPLDINDNIVLRATAI